MRKALISARKSRKLTQQNLGDLVGLSNKAISAIERGRIDGKIHTWDAFEDIFGVPQRELRKMFQNQPSAPPERGAKTMG